MSHSNERVPSSLALTMGLLAGVCATFLPLVPEPYRPYNFAVFGAIGLFVSARVGVFRSLGITLGGKTLSDLLRYLTTLPCDADNLPIWYVVASFGFYPVFGLLLRKSDNPLRIWGAALAASIGFYTTTNFVSWLRQDLPYGYTLTGLIECYWQAIPFYRGTLFGDLIFTTALFASHALLCRSSRFNTQQAILIPVEHGERR